MNSTSFKFIVTAIFTATLLSIFFIKTQSNYVSQHEDVIETIRAYNQTDAQLNQNILMSRYNMLSHYDSLVNQSKQLSKILQHLRSNESAIYRIGVDELDASIDELEIITNEKSVLLERFKSRNALLKNSLHFLPTSANRLAEKLSHNSQTKKLSTDITNLLNNVLSYSITSDDNFRQDITELVKKIAKSQQTLSGDFQDELTNISNHTKVILTEKKAVDKIVSNLISREIHQTLDRLLTIYNQHNSSIANDASIYRTLLYIFTIVLLSLVGYTIIRLRNNSTILRRAYTDLNYQKFALDQHSIVSITDANGNILYANDRFLKISQYSINELLHMSHSRVSSNYHSKPFFHDMWKTIKNGAVWHGEICNKKKDGSLFWVNSSIVPFMDSKDKPYQYINISTDITSQKNTEEALYREKELAETTLHAIADGVITTNALGDVTYLNPTAERLTGCSEHEAKGKPLEMVLMVFDETSHKPIKDIIRPCLNSKKPTSLENVLLVQREGPSHSIELAVSPLYDRDNQVLGTVLVFHDVTDMRRLTQQMTFLASHDPLTGLVNRREFKSRLKKMFDSAKQHKHEHALCYIDLDQFKIINDTCGHVAGDELLKQLTTLLSDKVRSRDTLARLGGDEFGLLLGECPLSRANKIAQDICNIVKSFRFIWDNKTFEVGASIGLVAIDQNSESITSLMSSADTACYAAKDKGRGRVHLYQEDDTELQQRYGEMQWVPKLNDALTNNNFILYCQTIMAISDELKPGKHFEVLLRMQGDDNSIILPGAFIPAAERYNLMPAIDRWVIENTLKTYDKIFKSHPECIHDTCSINLSGASLNDSDFLSFIFAQLDKYLVPPQILCFEITETAAISNLSTAVAFIKELKRRGCKFSLDDFGSGLSSFAYLKNLPVDYLKIDGNFIIDMAHDPIDRAMVESINQVGHVMGLRTIAEYIESESLLTIAKEIGVDYAQGYAIGRPTPITEYLKDYLA